MERYRVRDKENTAKKYSSVRRAKQNKLVNARIKLYYLL